MELRGRFWETPEFLKLLSDAEEALPPYDRAVIYLRAVAAWSDEELLNPIMARACRDCAMQGLAALGEPLEPSLPNPPA